MQLPLEKTQHTYLSQPLRALKGFWTMYYIRGFTEVNFLGVSFWRLKCISNENIFFLKKVIYSV